MQEFWFEEKYKLFLCKGRHDNKVFSSPLCLHFLPWKGVSDVILPCPVHQSCPSIHLYPCSHNFSYSAVMTEEHSQTFSTQHPVFCSFPVHITFYLVSYVFQNQSSVIRSHWAFCKSCSSSVKPVSHTHKTGFRSHFWSFIYVTYQQGQYDGMSLWYISCKISQAKSVANNIQFSPFLLWGSHKTKAMCTLVH